MKLWHLNTVAGPFLTCNFYLSFIVSKGHLRYGISRTLHSFALKKINIFSYVTINCFFQNLENYENNNSLCNKITSAIFSKKCITNLTTAWFIKYWVAFQKNANQHISQRGKKFGTLDNTVSQDSCRFTKTFLEKYSSKCLKPL